MNSTTKITKRTFRDKKGNLIGWMKMTEEKDFSGYYEEAEFKNITKGQLLYFLLEVKVKELKDGSKTRDYLKTLKKMDKTEMIYRAMCTKISFDGVEEPVIAYNEQEMVNHIRKNY